RLELGSGGSLLPPLWDGICRPSPNPPKQILYGWSSGNRVRSPALVIPAQNLGVSPFEISKEIHQEKKKGPGLFQPGYVLLRILWRTFLTGLDRKILS